MKISLKDFLIFIYFLFVIVVFTLTEFKLRLSSLVLLALPLAFFEKKPLHFLIQWFPFVAIIFIYDSFRGIADELGARVNYETLPMWEKTLFGLVLPSEYLQNIWGASLRGDLGRFLCFIYFGHFILPLVFLYLLWRKNLSEFRLLCLSLAVVSCLGFITYALFPTAPPWMASAKGIIGPVQHLIVYHLNRLAVHLPTVYMQMNPNPVAAFPSLHTAYPFILCLIASRSFPSLKLLLGLNFLLVCFTIVAFGEHYVVDLIAGVGYGISAFILSISLNKYLSMRN